MDVFVLDIGCTNLKGLVIRQGQVMEHWVTPVSKDTSELLAACISMYANVTNHGYAINRHIVLSHSDGIIYEEKDGTPHRLATDFDIPFQKGLPPAFLTGKPLQPDLKGIGNQLLWLQNQGISPRRVLPVSTYVAAYLCGNREWIQWDITHASNSGVYDQHQMRWHPIIEDFISKGAIAETILAPNARIPNTTGMDFCVGGHDTLLAVSETVTPYVSCGTWITASVPVVEADTALAEAPAPPYTRYLRAPDGTLLRQICFANNEQTVKYINSHISSVALGVEIPLFGSWAGDLYRRLRNTGYQCFVNVDPDGTYLHRQAALYAGGCFHRKARRL